MALKADELFQLAYKVEEQLSALYSDVAEVFPEESEVANFFRKLSSDENVHRQWVEEMTGLADLDYVFEDFGEEDFKVILGTIQDVHDEVCNHSIDLHGSLEIMAHLENSTADTFYNLFPKDIPGLPYKHIDRMIQSCDKHAKAVTEFQSYCLSKFPADA